MRRSHCCGPSAGSKADPESSFAAGRVDAWSGANADVVQDGVGTGRVETTGDHLRSRLMQPSRGSFDERCHRTTSRIFDIERLMGHAFDQVGGANGRVVPTASRVRRASRTARPRRWLWCSSRRCWVGVDGLGRLVSGPNQRALIDVDPAARAGSLAAPGSGLTPRGPQTVGAFQESAFAFQPPSGHDI